MDLLRAACDTLDAWFALGNESVEVPGGRLVRNREAPFIYDANHAQALRAETPDAVDALFAAVEEGFTGIPHRYFYCDPLTPPLCEARLTLEGYRVDAELQLVLEGELRADPARVEIRPVRDDADWETVLGLTRLDHTELGRRQGRSYGDPVSVALVEIRRAKAPEQRTWLARVDGVDCAYLSSWPGRGGVGKVEDLFTHPDFRHRGIATALIAHAVEDARARGAGPVLIGADATDTPMLMYAALGFRPLCVRRGYLKRLDDAVGVS